MSKRTRGTNGDGDEAVPDDAISDEPTDLTEDEAIEDEAIEDEATEPSDAGGPDGEVGGAPTTTIRARRRAGTRPAAKQAVNRSIFSRLYHGETNFDFVGRKRLWFTISLVAVVISLGSLVTRGLNLGIDFEGGVVWEVPAAEASVAEARGAVDQYGLAGATITVLESDEGRTIPVSYTHLTLPTIYSV